MRVGQRQDGAGAGPLPGTGQGVRPKPVGRGLRQAQLCWCSAHSALAEHLRRGQARRILLFGPAVPRPGRGDVHPGKLLESSAPLQCARAWHACGATLRWAGLHGAVRWPRRRSVHSRPDPCQIVLPPSTRVGADGRCCRTGAHAAFTLSIRHARFFGMWLWRAPRDARGATFDLSNSPRGTRTSDGSASCRGWWPSRLYSCGDGAPEMWCPTQHVRPVAQVLASAAGLRPTARDTSA